MWCSPASPQCCPEGCPGGPRRCNLFPAWAAPLAPGVLSLNPWGKTAGCSVRPGSSLIFCLLTLAKSLLSPELCPLSRADMRTKHGQESGNSLSSVKDRIIAVFLSHSHTPGSSIPIIFPELSLPPPKDPFSTQLQALPGVCWKGPEHFRLAQWIPTAQAAPGPLLRGHVS